MSFQQLINTNKWSTSRQHYVEFEYVSMYFIHVVSNEKKRTNVEISHLFLLFLMQKKLNINKNKKYPMEILETIAYSFSIKLGGGDILVGHEYHSIFIVFSCFCWFNQL